jgi:hypothetical protein
LLSGEGGKSRLFDSPQRGRVVAAAGDRGRVGDELANFLRVEAHLRQIVPQHLLAIIVFVFGADLLQASGIFNGFIVLYSVTDEHCAGQIEEVAELGGALLDGEGGGFTGAFGRLGCSGSG